MAQNLKNPRIAGGKTVSETVPPAFIVGVGASAGGLEALEQFLRSMPCATGLAFVIVQHLDPGRKCMMTELLQRITPMTVVEVQDLTRVLRNCVYMIPPNKDMSILHGVLHLLEPDGQRGLRLPIDFFFHSLATDQKARSVGVILSGMGTDGTLGLRSIHEKHGLCVVQEPSSAKFAGMPQSAIATGLADIVAPGGEMGRRMLDILTHKTPHRQQKAFKGPGVQGDLDKILILLRGHTGHDFSEYKNNTLFRRIERRMGLHQITQLGIYVRYLRENPQELALLFKELLIGVTNFFRDPAVWDKMRDETLPELILSRTEGDSECHTLRAWVPGCSSGEEAYSLAIVFKEALEACKPDKHLFLQIFATDLDQDAVEKARQGFFHKHITTDVSPERLNRCLLVKNAATACGKKFGRWWFLHHKTGITLKAVRIEEPDGSHFADVVVHVFERGKELAGMTMIVFCETQMPEPANSSKRLKALPQNQRVRDLESELQSARAELQNTRELMQSSEEEFKSMNEEMQSTNEELQSSNEELTTSKEEMQSLNEELQTVNAELQAKLEELSSASNDMKNLLNSTEIATVFLDSSLRIRRFTEQATKIIKLIPGDVGRPFTDLASDLVYPEMAGDAAKVLDNLVPMEKPVNTGDGRWFSTRLMPYRTMDNRIDGVVITFSDISTAKKLEAELRAVGDTKKENK